MSTLETHISTLKRDFDAVAAAWNALSVEEREESWDAFVDMLDYGDAGYHPFALILHCAWDDGADIVNTIRRNGPW